MPAAACVSVSDGQLTNVIPKTENVPWYAHLQGLQRYQTTDYPLLAALHWCPRQKQSDYHSAQQDAEFHLNPSG